MTSADYIDRDGIAQHEKHFWAQEDVFSRSMKKPISSIVKKTFEERPFENKERIDNFQIASDEQEDKISRDIEARGGKVIKLTSQPISKRRYKRNVAKLLAKEKATY